VPSKAHLSLVEFDQYLLFRNTEKEMDISHTGSKLRTTSNALNFNPCNYTFRMHPVVFVDACSNEDEYESFNVNHCRPHRLKPVINTVDLSVQESTAVNLSDQVQKSTADIGLNTATLPKISNPACIKNSPGIFVRQ
jgi:hypothetical protein